MESSNQNTVAYFNNVFNALEPINPRDRPRGIKDAHEASRGQHYENRISAKQDHYQ